MSFFLRILACIIGGITLGLIARSYLTPKVVETKVVETKEVDKDVKIKIVKTTTKKPDGEETTTIVTTKDIDTHTSTISQPEPLKTNVSLLIATKPELPIVPVYGISVTRQVLGNLTVGGFMLTDKTIGASIGISF